MKKTIVNPQDIITDYTDGNMGVEGICAKYHIGKVKVRNILKENNIPMKTRGGQSNNETFLVPDYHTKKYIERDGYHFEAHDKNSSYTTNDYMNAGGFLTSYINKTYGVEIPTLYDRRMHYMRTGNYWWEQWFDIVEVKDNEMKKCPYCDWTTTDVNNLSGAFEVHLKNTHGITKEQYIAEHPEDMEYFRLKNPVLDRQFETDESKFVTCKVCGRKLAHISNSHLKTHGMTKLQYIEKFGITGLVSKAFHERQSAIAIEGNKAIKHSYSSADEKEIGEFITSLGFEWHTDRQILNGQELDIYIPAKNLAIEYNGNLWHSEQYGKKKTYHLHKLEKCNNAGINLIQIFEDEFALKKDIVFSKLKHILNCDNDTVKIMARKCLVSNITKEEAEAFLNNNHIQGFVNSSIYMGAFYENRLIAVMSFIEETKGHWNLSRFATLQNTICQGVASKIFTHFIRENKPVEVKSFADRRWTLNATENLYTKLGFKLTEITRPEYRYYNSKIDRYMRFHKFNFRKQLLAKRYDLPIEMTESEMTKALGYTRIWDCGLFKYVWTTKKELS